MSSEPQDRSEVPPADRCRALLSRSALALPVGRVKEKPKPAATAAASSENPRAEAPRPLPGAAHYLRVKGELHERLLEEVHQRNLLGAGEEALAEVVRDFVERVLAVEELPLNEAERKQLADDLLEETVGVGPLAPLMADPAVTDILVNGPEQVYIERFGRLEETDVRFRHTDHLVRIIQRIAARVGRHVDEASPMVDARLPDGSRVNATLPPVALDGPTLSIRRFGRQRLRREDLLRLGMLSPDMNAFLELAVKARKNLLISGGTGAGKTTFLGAVAEAIPATERIITIEDAAELILDQRHVVRLETRPPNVEGKGRITTRDLVINVLRMRPDRIIVGECRGGEALDMLQAMNTGHDGSLTTVHANSPRDALARLETMVLMAGTDLPSRSIREQIVSALYLIVHVHRFEDGVRRVSGVSEIVGLEGLTPLTQEIFRFERRGRKGRNVAGEHVATGVVPRLVEELRERDVQVPMSLFQKPRGGAMPSVVGAVLLVVIAAVAFFLWRRIEVQRRSRERLAEPEPPVEEARPDVRRAPPPPARRYVRSYWFVPWIVGVFVALAVGLVLRWPLVFALTFGIITGLLGGQLESFRIGWVTFKIEQQLADALDLMVAALQAGAGTMSALDGAVKESKPPLRPQLDETLGRIRYGDDPQVVLRALERRVSLEVFRLFVSALSVHWETGGSLAPTLATVGQVVRDRIEVNRRIRTLTTQGRLSVIAVLFLTYFLALIMWRNDPDRMTEFLDTTIGQWLTAGAMLLQGVGIVWSSYMSRLKY